MVAQKILSCVARVKERFGVGHVVSVLRGEDTERVRQLGHDGLSTYGLLREHAKADVRDWVHQLIGQGVLVQQGDPYPLLQLNPASWEVMKGQRAVRLVQPARRKKGEEPEKSKADAVSWEGVDRELFEVLRGLRKELAQERGVPPYVIFNDGTLRELARVRPTTPERMYLVSGVGKTRLADFGGQFLEAIKTHCRQHGLETDLAAAPAARDEVKKTTRPNPTRDQALRLFGEQAAIEDVMHQTGRGRATVVDYLCDYIRDRRPASITAWVPELVYQRVMGAARQVGTERLKPIYLALGEQVSYDDIRLVVAHLETISKAEQGAAGPSA
jgi:ATP-dependent DNA helicase RecQ